MNLWFIIKEGTRNFFKGGLTSITGFFVFSVVFSILLVFFVFSFNIFKFKKTFENRFEIIVFLKEEADEKKVMEDLKKMEGIKALRFVSKTNGLLEVKKLLGKDSAVVDIFEESPLPNTIRIKLEPFYINRENLKILEKKLGLISGISEVWMEKNIIIKMKNISKLMLFIDTGLFIFVTLAGIFVIFIVTRLAIYTRIREYDFILFVGGTPFMARGPFIIEGVIHGFLGSLLSLIFAYLLYLGIKSIFSYIEFSFSLFSLSVLFGMLIGFIGSSLAAESFPIRK